MSISIRIQIYESNTHSCTAIMSWIVAMYVNSYVTFAILCDKKYNTLFISHKRLKTNSIFKMVFHSQFRFNYNHLYSFMKYTCIANIFFNATTFYILTKIIHKYYHSNSVFNSFWDIKQIWKKKSTHKNGCGVSKSLKTECDWKYTTKPTFYMK